MPESRLRKPNQRETQTSERRRAPRGEVVIGVEYRTVDELFTEFARNINEGGIFVETESPPPAGTSISLQFRLPGSTDPIKVSGTVVRTSDGHDGTPGMGIEFGELDAASRRRIDELVRRLRSDLR